MRYLKPLRPFLGWSQLSIPTVYDDSLSYYEVLNKCIFHFNEMLKTMQENYEIIDEAFAKILEECEAAIARCEEAAARAEAAQSAAEKAQAAAEAAQAAAEAAQKLAEAAQAAAETARDDAITAQKAAETAQAAAEAAQTAAEAAQQKAETAQAAAEAAQEKAEDAQAKAEAARDAAQAAQTGAESAKEKAEAAQAAAESARDAAQAAQTAAEAAQTKAEAAQTAAENARDAAQAAQSAAETAQAAAESAAKNAAASEQAAANSAASANTSAENAKTSETNAANSATAAAESASNAEADATNAAESAEHASTAADQAAASATDAADSAELAGQHAEAAEGSAQDAAASAEEIKNALDNYYDKTESDNTFVKKTGDTMTGNLVMKKKSHVEGSSSGSYFNSFPEDIEDLNNLNVNGYYFSRENLTNSPKFSHYFLYNNMVPGTSYITQIAFQRITGNNIAIRNYRNTWSNWTYFTTQDDITDNYLPLSGGTMTGNITMSNNTELIGNASTSNTWKYSTTEVQDLNDLKTPGIYNIRGNTTVNSPSNEDFDIIVLKKDRSYLYTQIAISNTYAVNMYIRVGNNNGFGKWFKFSTTNDLNNSLSGYLPLTGGTMTGNILGSKDSFTTSNNAYFDGFSSGLIIHPISEGNPDINSVAEPGIYYTSSSLNNFSNIPEDITSLSWYMITKYPNGGASVLLHELTTGKIYVTKGGVHESIKITPNSWVRLNNITEKPTNGTPIFYKRIYSTDNKFFANIYKIAGDERKAKVDIYVNNLESEFNLSFSTDYETFPAIFKIEGTNSTFNGENLPFELKTTMDLVVGNYMVEKSSKYIGLVNLNYTISFSGYDSYIKPYFNGILLESSVLNKGTTSDSNPIFITSFINDVNSRWTWD